MQDLTTPRDQRPPLPDFTPVPRKPRSDGWTPARQKAFIEALADTGSVKHAAKAVNMSRESAYALRRQPGADSFAAAWEAAQGHGVRILHDVTMERAIHGVEEPVFQGGRQVGTKRRYNDRLAMFHLRQRQQGNVLSPSRVIGAAGREAAIREVMEDHPGTSRHAAEIIVKDPQAYANRRAMRQERNAQRMRDGLTALMRDWRAEIAVDPAKIAAFETLFGRDGATPPYRSLMEGWVRITEMVMPGLVEKIAETARKLPPHPHAIVNGADPLTPVDPLFPPQQAPRPIRDEDTGIIEEGVAREDGADEERTGD